MTWALCFGCGEIKFGAICPCERCGIASTGDMQLDIAFSDHTLSVETLREFGAVVAAIQAATGDKALGLLAFLCHVGERYPDILTLPESESDERRRAEALLEPLDLPPVTLRPGREAWTADEAPADD